MALALSGSLALSDSASYSDRLPRILYHNHLEDATVTASTEQTGYGVGNTYDGFTDTAWIGDEGETSWTITVSKSGASADYCALMAWDLSGTTITVQSSDDGGTTWDDVAGPVMSTDRVVAFLFDEETHDLWRVSFSGTTPPEVASVSLGLATDMPRGLPVGFEPPRQARNNTITNNRTDQGHLAGRSIIRRGIETSLSFKHLDPDWIRDTWEPFIDHAETKPWFFVWSPVDWPNEVAFLWTDGDIRPPRYSSAKYMDVQLSVKGFAK